MVMLSREAACHIQPSCSQGLLGMSELLRSLRPNLLEYLSVSCLKDAARAARGLRGCRGSLVGLVL